MAYRTLTEQQKKKALELYYKEGLNRRTIAKRFSVGANAIGLLIQRDTLDRLSAPPHGPASD
jgi:transposase